MFGVAEVYQNLNQHVRTHMHARVSATGFYKLIPSRKQLLETELITD